MRKVTGREPGEGLDRRTFACLAASGMLCGVTALRGGAAALALSPGVAGGTAPAAAAAAGADTAPVIAGGGPQASPGGGTARAIIVNALGGLDDPNLELDRQAGTAAGAGSALTSGLPDLDRRVIEDARASGLTAVNVTLGYVAGPDEPFESTVRAIGVWDRALREHAGELLKVYTAEDILRAGRLGQIGIIFGFQNAAALGDRADRVEVFGNLGVRVIQLTYNPPNRLGDGSMAAENRGLTPFGREVVAHLDQARIMVDLSHSGERTCLDAAAASTRPVSINHTGCRALVDLPRNKTDEELRLVASRGGFVGIFFMPFLSPSGHATAADVVAHIDHAIQVCGEDHVGIGTDGSVTPIDDLATYRKALAKEVAERAAAGIGATGERADTLPFVVDLRGVDQFRRLAALLDRRGYSTARIEKILGRNFLRVATDVWGS